MNNFNITEKEAEEIFREKIIPQIILNFTKEEKKEAYILGGQPGSGKSALAREIIKKNKNIVFINGDDLRAFHPMYFSYLKENDQEAADRTQIISNFWVEMAIKECIERSLNFIVEGTMRTKEVPQKTATLLRDAKYFTNLAVVSAPYDLSLLSLEYRYEALKKLGQQARFTKKESHDEAFEGIEKTLFRLVNSQLFDQFFVYERYLGVFKENVFSPEQSGEALKVFKEGRQRLVEREEKERINFETENEFKILIK